MRGLPLPVTAWLLSLLLIASTATQFGWALRRAHCPTSPVQRVVEANGLTRAITTDDAAFMLCLCEAKRSSQMQSDAAAQEGFGALTLHPGQPVARLTIPVLLTVLATYREPAHHRAFPLPPPESDSTFLPSGPRPKLCGARSSLAFGIRP
jgi:hypothetical protein